MKELQGNGLIVSRDNNILIEALGALEYSGRVRGKGKHHTPHQYFNNVAYRALRDFIATSEEEQRKYQDEVQAKLSQVESATPQYDVSNSNMKKNNFFNQC